MSWPKKIRFWHDGKLDDVHIPIEKGSFRMPELLLDVKGPVTPFKAPDGIVHAEYDAVFGLKEGETLDMAGESGCGRSITMLSVLGLIPDSPGKITVGEVLF